MANKSPPGIIDNSRVWKAYILLGWACPTVVRARLENIPQGSHRSTVSEVSQASEALLVFFHSFSVPKSG